MKTNALVDKSLKKSKHISSLKATTIPIRSWLRHLSTRIVAITIVIVTLLNLSGTHSDAGKIIQVKALGETSLIQATGPLRVDPVNPRYFTDGSGRAIYLTGSHTWANFQDIGLTNPPVAFDYNAYLNFLQANNHNFFRLWFWEQSKWVLHVDSGYYFLPLAFQRTGPGNALDGQLKFDVTKFDQSFFDRMRSRIISAGNKGIYVSIMLFDGFSVDCPKAQYTDCTDASPANPWRGHPFNANNNINNINGDPNNDKGGSETHTLQIPAITTIQEAYVKKVIDTVGDLDNVLYEISNESNSNSQAWQYHMIDYIKNYESTKPKQHPVGMTVEYPNGNNSELFNSPADWISPNGDSGNYMTDPSAATGNKVIVIDSDHLWGEALPPSPSVWVWKSFTRGLNVLFMDCYLASFCDSYSVTDPARSKLVANLGYTRSYADRMDLEGMIPQQGGTNPCSTGFCLYKTGMEYLVYRPSSSGSVTVNLTAASGQLSYEWFNPANGSVVGTGNTTGGASRTFTSPFSGDAVLYIYSAGLSVTSTPTNTPLPTNTPNLTRTSTATPTRTPYGGTAWTIPGTIQAEDFDNGGEGVAYHDVTSLNEGGQYRTGEAVDIETTTDTGGGYNVGYIKDSEWMEYTMNVTTTSTYSLGLRLANTASGSTMHVEVDGVNVTGTITIPNTTNWQSWQTVTIPNISLSAGMHILRLAFDNGTAGGYVGNINYVTFSLNGPTATPIPSITPSVTRTSTNTPIYTATPTWTRTNTPVLPTVTRTSTSVPANTVTVMPTFVPTKTLTLTNTVVPPTATPISVTDNTLYVSSSGSGTVGGVSFADEDILTFNKATASWTMYFDGSDVGLSTIDVNAFALMPDDSLLLSLDAATSVSGLGTVDDSDIIRFIPTSLGDNTVGTFEWYFDGSDVGLTRSGEDIDAIDFAPNGDLVISTTDTFSVTGASGGDEDLIAFSPTSLGSATSGTWSLYFDGSDVGLADSSNEDVNGLWIDETSGEIYLSTLGAFSVPGVSGDGADIFICTPGSLGSNTSCTYDPNLYWEGSLNGFAGQVVDGFDIVLSAEGWTSTPASMPTSTSLPAGTAIFTPTNVPVFTYTPTRTPIPTTDIVTITIGETNILSTDDTGNGNLLVAQQAVLSQNATIQSLSLYIATTGGQLRLGIYSDNGGNPGALLAQTVAFTPAATGWNTQNVQVPVLLQAGTYWLTFLSQSNTMHYRVGSTGSVRGATYTFGIMPTTYPGSPMTGTFHWSFYATFTR